MVDLSKTHWAVWPFAALWNLVAYIISLTGRLTAIIIGLVLMLVGAILSATIIGAVLGIPLLILGGLLTVRGLW